MRAWSASARPPTSTQNADRRHDRALGAGGRARDWATGRRRRTSPAIRRAATPTSCAASSRANATSRCRTPTTSPARCGPMSMASPPKIARRSAGSSPNQNDNGAHMNMSGGGVAANAPNRENAIAFLEYLASDQAQSYFSAGNDEYPAVPGWPALRSRPRCRSWESSRPTTSRLPPSPGTCRWRSRSSTRLAGNNPATGGTGGRILCGVRPLSYSAACVSASGSGTKRRSVVLSPRGSSTGAPRAEGRRPR
jgi:hypothetical protein